MPERFDFPLSVVATDVGVGYVLELLRQQNEILEGLYKQGVDPEFVTFGFDMRRNKDGNYTMSSTVRLRTHKEMFGPFGCDDPSCCNQPTARDIAYTRDLARRYYAWLYSKPDLSEEEAWFAVLHTDK